MSLEKALSNQLEKYNKLVDKDTYYEQRKDELLSNKVPSKNPKFVILYGPPASGKGHLLKKIQNQFDLEDNTTIDVNVDSFVETNPSYLKDLNAIRCIENYQRLNCTQPIQHKFITDCNALYKKYRELGADYMSSAVMIEGLRHNYNIIYETTGRDVTWLLEHDVELIPSNYKIVLLYPVVDETTINQRSCERAKKIGRYVTKDEIKAIIGKVGNNFVELSNKLPKADIHVYDNKDEPKVIYQKLGGFELNWSIIIIILIVLIIFGINIPRKTYIPRNKL